MFVCICVCLRAFLPSPPPLLQLSAEVSVEVMALQQKSRRDGQELDILRNLLGAHVCVCVRARVCVLTFAFELVQMQSQGSIRHQALMQDATHSSEDSCCFCCKHSRSACSLTPRFPVVAFLASHGINAANLTDRHVSLDDRHNNTASLALHLLEQVAVCSAFAIMAFVVDNGC